MDEKAPAPRSNAPGSNAGRWVVVALLAVGLILALIAVKTSYWLHPPGK